MSNEYKESVEDISIEDFDTGNLLLISDLLNNNNEEQIKNYIYRNYAKQVKDPLTSKPIKINLTNRPTKIKGSNSIYIDDSKVYKRLECTQVVIGEKLKVYDRTFNTYKDSIYLEGPCKNYSYSAFYKCTFNNLNLEDIDFSNCTFKECTFTNCRIIKCKGNRNLFNNCSFIDIYCINTSFVESKWIDCTLDKTDKNKLERYMFGLDLSLSKLANCSIHSYYINSTNLFGSVIKNCILKDICLKDAECTYALIKETRVYGVIVDHGDFTGTRFSEHNLKCTEESRYQYPHEDTLRLKGKVLGLTLACPSEGSFIGWKLCNNNRIVKLYIPEDALRLSSTNNKCRCSAADVISIEDQDGATYESATSLYDKTFTYKVGQHISIGESFDTDRWHTCSEGIHFFMTKQEAIDYSL